MIDWPSGLLPSSCDVTLVSKSSSFESPFNGVTQTVTYPGTKWQYKMSFENLDDAGIRSLNVFLAKMNGQGGRTKLRDFSQAGVTPQGVPVVYAASGSTTLLSTSGWTPNTLVLKNGDYLTVNDMLLLADGDITSDDNGRVVIPVYPPMRKAPTVGASIETLNPYGVFRLSDDENGGTREPAWNGNFTVNFIEAIFG